MTSIVASASTSSSYLTPLQKLQHQLQAEVASGKVTPTDSDVPSQALTDIDSSMQSGRSDPSRSAQSKPADLTSKIDDLIDAQVSSGKLTLDQATELHSVFEAAFSAGPGGAGGPSGPRSTDGPVGSPPDDSSTEGAETTDSSTDSSQVLQKLLASFRESLAASSPNSYSATGSLASTKSTSASFSALLVNYTS